MNPLIRIVVAEPIAEAGLDALAAEAAVVVACGESRDALLRLLEDADALIVRSVTRVDAPLLAAAPRLRVVGRAGVGVDNIDLESAAASGVVVVSVPDANAVSAAEHTMALLLSQARRIPEADRELREGRWDREGLSGVEVFGKTLGVVGLGRIGTMVAERAAAFGMRLLAFDPHVDADHARSTGVELRPSLNDLLARSDFLTVHVPGGPATAGMIGSAALRAAKPGIRIVNTSRGAVVDEAALAEAILEGRVAGAALDVFAVEPVVESVLFSLPQVVVTPHIGGSTAESRERVGLAVAEAVLGVLRGAPPVGGPGGGAGPPASG